MPKPYPREFRDDVVRVARGREPGVTVEQIVKDFGVHPMTLFKWLRQADIDAGATPGTASTTAMQAASSTTGRASTDRSARVRW
ncbi:transposase [Micromonospora sp. NPDC126480]|uniref:transposase n=1 Tax=Micromonospora sp. NPDC126480 TaxID=3155312 RepID=UPI0033300DA3